MVAKLLQNNCNGIANGIPLKRVLGFSSSGIAITYRLSTVFDLEFHGDHGRHHLGKSAADLTGNWHNGIPFSVIWGLRWVLGMSCGSRE